jgi:hypothetical protein
VAGRRNGPGMYTSPAASGYSVLNTVFEDNGIGLHLGAMGTRPTLVCGNLFAANNKFEGAGGANEIYSDEGARQVLITANRFERHNLAAIFFADIDGNPRMRRVLQRDIVVEGNASVDDLSFAVVFNSTRVRVTGNDVQARVGDSRFPGPASAIRIGARNRDVVVDNNRIRSASGNGIDVTDVGEPRRPAAAPRSIAVLENKVTHAELLGIDVTASARREYEVRGNRALDNGGTDGFDCQDESDGEGPADGTAGTENTWQDNVGARAKPAAICAAPTGDDRPAGPGRDHGRQWGDKQGDGHKQHKGHRKHRPDPCVCGTLPWRFWPAAERVGARPAFRPFPAQPARRWRTRVRRVARP